MLGKLLRYEIRATGRFFLPCFAGVLGLSILSRVFWGFQMHNTSSQFLNIFTAVFTLLLVLMTVASVIIATLGIIYRFYKNLLSNEGYLMHTLPVSVHQLICSKLIAAVCWMTVTSVFIYGCLFGVAFRAEIWAQVLSELRVLFERLSLAYGIGAAELVSVVLELCVLLLLGSMSSCLLFYASLAIGHSLPRHKLLASLGVFLGFGLLSQVLTMLLAVVTGYSLRGFVSVLNLKALAQFGHALLIGGIALNAVYCVVLYLITARMLSRRLDLE